MKWNKKGALECALFYDAAVFLVPLVMALQSLEQGKPCMSSDVDTTGQCPLIRLGFAVEHVIVLHCHHFLAV